MFIKIVKNSSNGSKDEASYHCQHIEVTYNPNADKTDTESIRVELCSIDGDPRSNLVVHLPQDAQVVYQMNDQGDTIDSYRLPPGRTSNVAQGGRYA